MATADLVGQAGWTASGFAHPLNVSGSGVDIADLTTQGALQLPGITGFSYLLPWTLTAVLSADGGADTGGAIDIGFGDESSGNVVVLSLGWDGGDFAANQLGTSLIFDAATSDSSGPHPFTAGANHTMVLHFDGADATLRIDGVLVNTIVGVDFTGVAAVLAFSGQTGDPADQITLVSLHLVQS